MFTKKPADRRFLNSNHPMERGTSTRRRTREVIVLDPKSENQASGTFMKGSAAEVSSPQRRPDDGTGRPRLFIPSVGEFPHLRP